MDQLKGKKTYIVAVFAGVLTGLEAAGIIETELANQLYAVLGSLGLATLRAGVSKPR